MLPARRHPLLTGLLFWYVGRLFRRHFGRLEITAPPELGQAEAHPLVLFSNHQTWWDGFFEIPLIQRHRLDYAIMMEEANLRRLWYFQHTGVFGVDLASAAGRAAGLKYAIRWLREDATTRRTLFIYPHGRLVSPHEPWPPFQPGLETLVHLSRAACAPVWKEIVYGAQPKPDVHLAVGPIIPASAKPTLRELDAALRQLRDGLRADLASDAKAARSAAR